MPKGLPTIFHPASHDHFIYFGELSSQPVRSCAKFYNISLWKKDDISCWGVRLGSLESLRSTLQGVSTKPKLSCKMGEGALRAQVCADFRQVIDEILHAEGKR